MAKERFTCRWAALSLSNIASVFIPDLLLPRPESEIQHELVAISTTGSRERAASWLAEHSSRNADSIAIYQSWEKLLEEGNFDVVYVSTPHPLHFQHVTKAITCRRHVLVEKPATMNRAQYEKLTRLALQYRVILMEGMWTRYLPAAKYLREELLPRIGQVKRVYAEFSFPIISSDLPRSSRFLDKQAGAGSLLDQGVYALTWADLALNGIAEHSTKTEVVHAHTMPVPEANDQVDDITTVIMSKREEPSGRQRAVAIVTTSMTIPGSSRCSFYQRLQVARSAPSVRIEGTTASVAIPFPPIRPQELQVQWYGDEFMDEDGAEKSEIILKPIERGWGLWYQADVMAEKIRARPTDGAVIGGEATLRVLGWMDQARALAGISYNDEIERV